MLYYLIHSLPWGADLQAGKRNVRTFLIGSICYILFHALLYSDVKIPNYVTIAYYILRKYFWWILAADAVAMAISYKIAYGRNILNELPLFEVIRDLFGGHPAPPAPAPAPQNRIINLPLEVVPPPSIPVPLPTPPLKTSTKYPNELDIDLLTENEELPDPKTVEIINGSNGIGTSGNGNEILKDGHNQPD
jgi:hypothetical protein